MKKLALLVCLTVSSIAYGAIVGRAEVTLVDPNDPLYGLLTSHRIRLYDTNGTNIANMLLPVWNEDKFKLVKELFPYDFSRITFSDVLVEARIKYPELRQAIDEIIKNKKQSPLKSESFGIGLILGVAAGIIGGYKLMTYLVKK